MSTTIELNLTATITTPEGAKTTVTHAVTLREGAVHHMNLVAVHMEHICATLGEDVSELYGFERVPEGGYWVSGRGMSAGEGL